MSKHEYLIKQLQTLGLKKEEAELYITLLELKSALLTDLAREIGANRTTLYPYMDSLLRLGLVRKSIKGKRVLYIAEDPSGLKDLQKKQERALSQSLDRLQEIFNSASNKPRSVLFYEGDDGIRAIYNEMISDTGFLYSIFSVDKYFELFAASKEGEKFLKEVERRGIDLRELVEDSESGREYKAYGYIPELGKVYKFKKRPIKILPKYFDVGSDILIAADKVAFVSLVSKSALLIKDKQIAAVQKNLFEQVWTSV